MHRTFSKFAIIGAAFAVIVGITVLITGQPASKLSQQLPSQHLVGVPDDWSHHHLVFSNPGAYEQAAKDPAALAKWLKIHYDTRFILQQMKRHAEAADGFSREMRTGGEEAVSPPGMVDPEDLAIGVLRQLPGEAIVRLKPKPKPKSVHPAPLRRDWSEPLTVSPLSGTVQPNAYPAKWGMSTTTALCPIYGPGGDNGDYVVYPTGTAGSSTAASIVAYQNLYVGCPTNPIFPTVPSIYWAYNTGGTISTSPIISSDGSQVAFIQVSGTSASLVLLKYIVNTYPKTLIANLSPTSPNVTISGGVQEFGWEDVGCLISDGGVGIPAGDHIATILGSDKANLVTAPSTESSDTLTVTPAAVGTPAVLLPVPNSDYPTCQIPCMTTLSLGANDTFSAPFYDYAIEDDAIYVGDDSGYLHKFTPVFNGTPSSPPAEVTTSPWPVPVSTKNLTSPVHDPVSGYVFVGDTGGYLYSVSSASGSVHGTSSHLGDVIIDGPLVDPSAQTVYAFVTTSGGSNTVYQFPTNFASGSGTSVPVGTGGTNYYLYAGDFDNVYYESPTTPPSGNLYVVGNTGVTTGATLYRIPITSNSMGTPVAAVPTLTGSSVPPWPSPLTEFCNNGYEGSGIPCTSDGTTTTGGTDYLFFSVNSGDLAGSYCTNGATNGCVLSYNISTPSSPTLSGSANVATPASAGCWATGGIVIDNSLPYSTLSQVYFINLNGNTAGGAGGATSTACAESLPASGTGTVTPSSTSVTSTTGITTADVGLQITDTTQPTCIPTNDTIAAYDNSTLTVTLATPTSGTCAAESDALVISANIQAVQASQSTLE